MTAKDELLSILRAAREATDRTVRFRGAELHLDLRGSLAGVQEVDPREEALYTPHAGGGVSRHCSTYAAHGDDVIGLRYSEPADGYAPADVLPPAPPGLVRGPDGRVFRFRPDYPDHEETP